MELVTRPDIATAKLAVRPGHMKVPVELLANGMDDDRILVFRKLVYPFCPERNGEANEENGFNEDHREFEVGRDAAFDSFVIGHRMPALAEPHEDYTKKADQPTKSAPMNQWLNSMM